MSVYRLENRVQPYAWGSPTVIPDLLGYPGDGTPAAELWMGVHPNAPSTVVGPGPRRSLADLIATDPAGILGDSGSDHLPFLLKILAVDQPLSLQAHPDAEQARAGYAEEEARGLDADAPARNYHDPNPKPEMVCAVTDFVGLSGFRPVQDSGRLLDALGGAMRARYRDRLIAPGGLRDVVTCLLTLPPPKISDLVDEVATAAAILAGGTAGPSPDGPGDGPGEFAAEAAWLVALAQAHPGDRGVLIAALLNLVRLPPGGVLRVPAGQLHAYLHGVGVEIMATSDNVLRGGLTAKHIDVAELLQILDLREDPAPPVQIPAPTAGWFDYRSDVPQFRLSRAELGPATVSEVARAAGAAQILLCTAGAAVVLDGAGGETELPQGASVFVTADDAVRVRARGPASSTVFAATANMGASET